VSRARLVAALGFEPSAEQWAVIEADPAPAVVIAGAGSGKTACMAARVGHLVAEGYARPDEVLGLTFTTKATAELLARVRSLLAALPAAAPPEPAPGIERGPRDDGVDGDDGADGSAPGDPVVLTYHAFAARILAEHGVRLGIEPDARVLSEAHRHQLAYRLVCRTDLPFGEGDVRPDTLTRQLLALDAALAELCVATEDLRAFDSGLMEELSAHASLQVIGHEMLGTARQRLLLAQLVDEWRAEKVRRRVVDFSDQLRLAGLLVADHPDIAADLRGRHRFVLLDEYQDTSIAQRRIMQAAFGAGHSVLAVGDPAQAIYGWRGASVANITGFVDHFPPAPGAHAARLDLTINRRSGAAILAAANEVAVDLRREHGLLPLEADPQRPAGRVECALLETYDDEIAWVASRIEECPPGRVDGEPARWRHIAVLCGRREDADAVDDALRRRGIPAYVAGAASLLAQPAVVEIRAILELLHEPTANPAFVRVAAGPRWRIGARDLAALGDRAAELAGGRHRGAQPDVAAALDDAVLGSDAVDAISLLEAAEDPGDPDRYSAEALERLGAVAAEVRALRRHVGEPMPDLIHRVLAVTGLDVELALGDPVTVAAQQDALAALLALAAESSALDDRFTLGAFLSFLRDSERFDVDVPVDARASDDAVQILTVHKAKGLEWPIVFVPFLADKAWPNGKARAQWPTSAATVPWPLRDDRTRDVTGFPAPGQAPTAKAASAYVDALRRLEGLEDRRLAYVAVTRARDRLVMSGHWWGPVQKKPRGPSVDLARVHDLLAGLDDALLWTDAPPDGAGNPTPGATPTPVPWPADPWPERRARVLAAARDVAQAMRQGSGHQAALPGVGDPVLGEGDDLIAALVAEERHRRAGHRSVRLPESLSATLLGRALRHPEETARDLARPMPQAPAPAADRGTRFHAYVEERFGRQQQLIDASEVPGSADAGIDSEADLVALKEAFERSPYAQRSPVAVEEPFAILVQGRVVVGRIDAIFREGDRYEVVDWKTGSRDHVDPMQLALYRLACAQARGIPVESVDAAFVFVATGEVLRPPTDALLADLGVSVRPAAG
jgi:DNA helicase-2/ATP-dependent DNA helicase PcrA